MEPAAKRDSNCCNRVYFVLTPVVTEGKPRSGSPAFAGKKILHWLILFLRPFYFRAVTLTKRLVLVRSYKRNQVLFIFLTDELKTVHIFAN